MFRKKEYDFFSFHGVWLLFVFSLVASLLCPPPHCTLAMKWSRIVRGLVALAAFYFPGETCKLNNPHLFTVTCLLAIDLAVRVMSLELPAKHFGGVKLDYYIQVCFQTY